MLSARDRLRLSSTLAAKTAALKAGAGLSARERMGLAKDIRELVAQLTGGVIGAGPATAEDELSDDPNSPNYRYKDTGYIADSRKEKAANQIKLAKDQGLQVQATSIDWKAIEQNPRAAAELIVKSNLFGQVDWTGLGEAGMDPAAGFLIDRIYASIAPQPEDNPQARHDYAVALTTIRTRLEVCKTVKEVRDVLAEILDELRGANLNEDETEKVAAINRRIGEVRQALKALSDPVSQLYNEAQALRGDEWKAENVLGQRKRRGWEIKPEHTQALADAKAKFKAAWDRWGEAVQDEKAKEAPLKAELGELMRQSSAISSAARARSEDSPLVRGWMSFGPKFLAVLKYRYNTGSDAFRNHVVNAENNRIKDWSWATKERPTVARGATKQEVQFQLKVADSFERKGGRDVTVDSTAELKSMFGLREVQSGNWVLKDPNSARFHVEQSAAAFADMADVLGIDAAHLGLGGRIGMAFGARGTGGKNAARAHWEPVHRVVNITKMGGGGCLGHELFHAIDNLMPALTNGAESKKDQFGTRSPDSLPDGRVRAAFAKIRKLLLTGEHRLPRTYDITDSDRLLAQRNLEPHYGFAPPIAALIKSAGNAKDAILAVESRITGTDKRSAKNRRQWSQIAAAYYTPPGETTITVNTGPARSRFAYEATLLDNGEAGKYWSEDVELAARAFQAYLEDSLEKQGRRNDYLSAFADNKHYDEGNPFPEGEERVALNAAFDELFSALREEKVFEKAAANKPLLDAIFGAEPVDIEAIVDEFLA